VSTIERQEPSLVRICACASLAIFPGYAVAFIAAAFLPWLASFIVGLLMSLGLSYWYTATRAGSEQGDLVLAAVWTAVSYVLVAVTAYASIYILIAAAGGFSG
jgi:uncharacterized membrane protein YidH (DUF202 family)